MLPLYVKIGGHAQNGRKVCANSYEVELTSNGMFT